MTYPLLLSTLPSGARKSHDRIIEQYQTILFCLLNYSEIVLRHNAKKKEELV